MNYLFILHVIKDTVKIQPIILK